CWRGSWRWRGRRRWRRRRRRRRWVPASPSPYHGGPDLINDDLLMTLSVRELNKRLHGCPRDQVVRLKQKRRTLKNRGYAQNCRSKRLQQRHDLELTNRHLHHEMQQMKVELAKIKQERDELIQTLQMRQREQSLLPLQPSHNRWLTQSRAILT
uniref:BZIP domain-containing protein n=1 Tax=Anopheles atroparvus TaxID=41427 RepID=A0AAG5DUS3_ANOAO